MHSTGFGCLLVFFCFQFWLGGWAFIACIEGLNREIVSVPIFSSFTFLSDLIFDGGTHQGCSGAEDASALVLALNSIHVTIYIVLYR